MAITTYNCTALTGGAERAIDALPVASLVTGDRALCSVGGVFSCYAYDSTGTAAENTTTHPYIIRPDDYASGGNWTEQTNFPLSSANLAMFMNAGGTALELAAGNKAGSFSRNLATATGNQAVTGVGFKPSAIVLLGCVNTGYGFTAGFLSDAGAFGISIYQADSMTGALRVYGPTVNDYNAITLASRDADGFTLTFAKSASAAGDGNFSYLAIR